MRVQTGLAVDRQNDQAGIDAVFAQRLQLPRGGVFLELEVQRAMLVAERLEYAR